MGAKHSDVNIVRELIDAGGNVDISGCDQTTCMEYWRNGETPFWHIYDIEFRVCQSKTSTQQCRCVFLGREVQEEVSIFALSTHSWNRNTMQVFMSMIKYAGHSHKPFVMSPVYIFVDSF